MTSIDCNCDGGPEGGEETAGCKHHYAVLLYINNSVDESKTDDACEWIEPSKMGKKKYPKGQPLEVIARIPEKHKCPPVLFQFPSDEVRENQVKIMEACGLTDSPLYKVYKFKPKNSSTAIKEKPDLPEWVKRKVFRRNPAPLSTLRKARTIIEQFFYDEHVVVTLDQAFKLCSKTVGQSVVELWRKERKTRITGSKVIS